MSERRPRWPSSERQLSGATLQPGGKFEQLIRDKQEFDLLAPAFQRVTCLAFKPGAMIGNGGTSRRADTDIAGSSGRLQVACTAQRQCTFCT